MLSSLFSGNVKETYNSLKLPPLAPPNIVFPIVWFILFTLMGIAIWLIINALDKDLKKRKIGIAIFCVQLFFNFLWSIVFFGMLEFWIALVIIIILDFLVMFMILYFLKINKLASYIMIPYLVWILFATYLNIWIAMFN